MFKFLKENSSVYIDRDAISVINHQFIINFNHSKYC